MNFLKRVWSELTGKERLPRTFGLSVWTVAGNVEPTPMAAHRQRAVAIRAALKPLPRERFDIDLSSLYDPEPRRLIELVITAYPPFDATTSKSTASLATALEIAGTDSGLARTIGKLADLVYPEQQGEHVGRIEFHLPDGNRVRCEANTAPAVIPSTRS